jgi:prepilin-type N-terminal cleavage/methylation domain-containing protein/prepilin-type processing-associated H-X9-DG protein
MLFCLRQHYRAADRPFSPSMGSLNAGCQRCSRNRVGFTLVELLVVIAIIGILIALLLPAVQSAREAARRTQCMDNLKQMGLACQTYASAKKSLPPGKTVIQNNCTSGVANYSNWALEILPYIDEIALYKSYDFTLINNDIASQNKQTQQSTGNLPVLQSTVQLMKCPSDPNQDPLSNTGNGPFNAATDPKIALGSYRGVAGRGFADAPGVANQNAYFDSAQIIVGAGNMRLRDKGPLPVVVISGACPNTSNLKAPVKVSQVTDGTSKTMLIGEYTTVSGLQRSAFWANSYYGMNLGSITVTLAYQTNTTTSMSFMSPTLDPDYDKCTTALSAVTTPALPSPSQPCNRSFAGLHGAGGFINFVFCDGSVHVVSSNTDIRILSDLATINGGESTQVP